jgi:type I restriction enzyme S subunit
MLTKTKFCSSFRMGQTILKEELIEDGEYPVFSATEGDHYFGRTNNPSFILEVGDIVIPARGNSIGHIALVHEAAVCTQTTIANFINKQKITSHYLFYFYKGFRKTLFHYDNTAIPQITVDQVKQNPVSTATIRRTNTNRKYLDHQTSYH